MLIAQLEGEACEGIRYLTVEDLVYINHHLIRAQTPNELIGVIKPNELESSQQRPAQHRYYTQQSDIYCLASVLIESIIRNHSFANANKRTAAAAGIIFLLLNGYELTAPDHEVITMMLGVANYDYSRDELENWLTYWSREHSATKLSLIDHQLESHMKLKNL
ncbi:TPA: type II toxin-antitoxin system death-on-curing family toxin [Pseudomonas aeruginosa]|nr:type II toxin-antitoxin system death-on-curing family toxin [Pseudomonas aeruginosa]